MTKLQLGAFLSQPAEVLAPQLLGWQLFHSSPEGPTAGIIVETEAYLSSGDLACHASRRQTKRNSVMFGPGGYAYVYFTYGLHYCFNITSGPEGRGEAVLIRALEPRVGLELMASRRGSKVRSNRDYCNGPAKLVQAMGITSSHNRHKLWQHPLYLAPPDQSITQIVNTRRIGISQAVDLPLRWYIEGSQFISKP
jgi:DNA-3-methyladenine glycosylase